MSLQQHHAEAAAAIGCAVATVSDTRTPETDTGGKLVAEMLAAAGHRVVAREIVRDDPQQIRPLLEVWRDDAEIAAILLTGGTGIAPRDQTYETVAGLLTTLIPGYGELFRQLSYEEIGPAAMLSRAIGGLTGRTVLLTMPGSPKAVKLAMEKLILPELGHLVTEANK